MTFQVLEILQKNREISRTFEEVWEPCQLIKKSETTVRVTLTMAGLAVRQAQWDSTCYHHFTDGNYRWHYPYTKYLYN